MNLEDLRNSKAALVTRTDVAKLLNLDVRTVSKLVQEGGIMALKHCGKVLIPRLPLLRLLESGAIDE